MKYNRIKSKRHPRANKLIYRHNPPHIFNEIFCGGCNWIESSAIRTWRENHQDLNAEVSQGKRKPCQLSNYCRGRVDGSSAVSGGLYLGRGESRGLVVCAMSVSGVLSFVQINCSGTFFDEIILRGIEIVCGLLWIFFQRKYYNEDFNINRLYFGVKGGLI